MRVRYWGAEWGSRKFDIYIDDEKLLTEDNTGKWNIPFPTRWLLEKTM
ncbi:hypothetical protein QUH73_17065 [Labilibaculum sp. K2S]|nr:hypothetical protein [Labilibaculum sp. K2S]MDM8161535.1 hypothetical protein [Labilibaculum sp. K2S]